MKKNKWTKAEQYNYQLDVFFYYLLNIFYYLVDKQPGSFFGHGYNSVPVDYWTKKNLYKTMQGKKKLGNSLGFFFWHPIHNGWNAEWKAVLASN